MTVNSSTDYQYIVGTSYGFDSINVSHSHCYANALGDSDILTTGGNNNSLFGGIGADILISTGDNNLLLDSGEQNFFIVGGNNNVASANHDMGYGQQTFMVYSYSPNGTNATLEGAAFAGDKNVYKISTGLVGVDGREFENAAYDSSTSETVNVAISHSHPEDSYYLRDYGMTSLNVSETAYGDLVLSSPSGRLTVTMQGDWEYYGKNNSITLDDGNGNLTTYTLEEVLEQSNNITPSGVSASGDYLEVSRYFAGNLIMSGSSANYINDQIVTIDATQNYQFGMQLGGNSNSNVIYAGYGSLNSLWGGQDTVTDYLFGGAGRDVFIIGKNDGSDAALANDYDIVYLYDVTVDDIVSYAYDANTIALGLNSGSVISIVNGDAISPTFVLADMQSYRFNRVAYSWQNE